MPFRRRTNRRRRRRRPRRRRRFRRSRRMSIIDPEKKALGFVLLGQAVNTAGALNFLNGMPQGITQNDRIGRQILMLSVFCRWEMALNPLTTQPAVMKMWLVHVSQPAGIQLAFMDFLQNPTIPTLSPRNLNNLGAFSVLWTTSRVLNIVRPNPKGVFMKKFRIKARYDAPGDQVADCDTGALYLCYASNDPTPTPPSLSFDLRLRYTG